MSAKRRSADSRKLLDLWSPPAGAGDPVALLATSFTFDSEFFEAECLGRFAGVQGKLGEGSAMKDLAYLLELEERLAELDVTVLVDRSYQSEGHPLRIDVVPIGQRNGLLHAKAALLVWKGWVRLFLGSANLTPAGYRRQIESTTVFDAHAGSQVPRSFFEEAADRLAELVELVPEDGLPEGPRARALRTLVAARRELQRVTLPERWPGRIEARVVLSRPGRSPLEVVDQLWKGGPARWATVFSPFFDTTDGENLPIRALAQRLAQRGERSILVLLPVDDSGSRTVVHAPASLRSAAPPGVDLELLVFEAEEEEERRTLHAKGILLESDSWLVALLGSSNFTSAGLGLSESRGHLELDLALAAPRESPEGSSLCELFEAVMGDAFDADQVDWIATEDEEESPVLLPWGFQRALLDPGPSARIELTLAAEDLPETWSVQGADGKMLLDSASWMAQGSPERIELQLPGAAAVFALLVVWTEEDIERRLAWALNVTDRGKLPPRGELRDLTVEEILQALASSRPIHEALILALERRETKRHAAGLDLELDPLKRYSSSGHLIARTRDFSRALAGLKRHLSKPAFSLSSLHWRLATAPWSPLALAQALLAEGSSQRALPGEAAFRLAELARALRTIDWTQLCQGLDAEAADREVRSVLDELRRTPVPDFEDPRLTEYVREALQGVGS